MQHTGNKEVKHLDWDTLLTAMVPSTTACPRAAAWSTFTASSASQRTLNLVSGQAEMGHWGLGRLSILLARSRFSSKEPYFVLWAGAMPLPPCLLLPCLLPPCLQHTAPVFLLLLAAR